MKSITTNEQAERALELSAAIDETWKKLFKELIDEGVSEFYDFNEIDNDFDADTEVSALWSKLGNLRKEMFHEFEAVQTHQLKAELSRIANHINN